MSAETPARIAVLVINLGIWYGILWFYVTMRRMSTRREMFSIRLRACTRLQLPLLRVLHNPTGAPKDVGQMMQQTADKMGQGQPLSEALNGHWAAVPWWYTRMLAVGEATGNLAGIFDLLIKTDERAEDRRISYFNQLLYPFWLLLVISTVFQGILIFIIPQFMGMFEELGVEQSGLQVAILRAANVLVPILPLVLVTLAALMASLAPFPLGPRWGSAFSPFRWLLWVWRRIIPGLGRAYFRAASARWAGVVGLMLQAGMPLPDALEEATDIENDPRFRRAARRWAEDVSSGKDLASVLSEHRFVPRSMVWQVRCASGGSDLPGVLREAGERECARLHQKVSYVFGLVSPFFVLAVGAMVGALAAGVFQYLTGVLYGML